MTDEILLDGGDKIKWRKWMLANHLAASQAQGGDCWGGWTVESSCCGSLCLLQQMGSGESTTRTVSDQDLDYFAYLGIKPKSSNVNDELDEGIETKESVTNLKSDIEFKGVHSQLYQLFNS